MNEPALKLWTGKTVHHRYAPFERRFAYDIILIDVDIDRLAEADRQSVMFGIDRPALFSLRQDEHGAMSPGVSLRGWAEEMFSSAGVSLAGGKIRLVTFPRHVFYKFAPLSLWYGYGTDGALKGIIYEVKNTFGEHHSYVASVDAPLSHHEADKSFHVSPFMDVSGKYRFTLRAPNDKLRVTVENWEAGKRTHMANIAAMQKPATSAELLRLSVVQPFSSIGVMAGIHWQALKVWIRGAGYRSRPPPPERPATIASPIAKHVPRRHGEPV